MSAAYWSRVPVIHWRGYTSLRATSAQSTNASQLADHMDDGVETLVRLLLWLRNQVHISSS
jgi:hypothetical protein